MKHDSTPYETWPALSVLTFPPPELPAGLELLPHLIERENLRGTFHNHTTASDGRATLEEMAAAGNPAVRLVLPMAEMVGWLRQGMGNGCATPACRSSG